MFDGGQTSPRYRDFWGSSLVVNDRLKARIEQICMKIGISQSSVLICIEKIHLIQHITVNPTYMWLLMKMSRTSYTLENRTTVRTSHTCGIVIIVVTHFKVHINTPKSVIKPHRLL